MDGVLSHMVCLKIAEIFFSGHEMETRLPKGHVTIDDQKCEHAFVIRDGPVMAEKLLQFIS